MGAIRQTASVKTDTVTTHRVRITVEPGVLPSMGSDDICEIELMIQPNQDNHNHKPVVKRIKLNYRDMVTLASEFVVRDW